MKDSLGIRRRRGGILILVILLMFAIFAVAGLLIDIGMARLTQTRLQSVTDAAALDGGWQMALGSDQTAIRDAAADRTDELFGTWSPKTLEFEGGYDLDGDGVLESSQKINTTTIGQPILPSLNHNTSNESSGDIVLGDHDDSLIPSTLPGLPTGYDRSPGFVVDSDSPNSILVRLRRTNEESIPGGTAWGNLPYLWARGSLLGFGAKGQGIAVRGETIAKLTPATAVGDAISELLPPALAGAIPVTEVTSETFDRNSLLTFSGSPQIGSLVTNAPNPSLTGIGYLPIAKQMSSGDWKVIGFMFASVTEDDIVPSTPLASGFSHANITSNLANITGLSDELVEANQSLDGPYIARAPTLARSQQINGVLP